MTRVIAAAGPVAATKAGVASALAAKSSVRGAAAWRACQSARTPGLSVAPTSTASARAAVTAAACAR